MDKLELTPEIRKYFGELGRRNKSIRPFKVNPELARLAQKKAVEARKRNRLLKEQNGNA